MPETGYHILIECIVCYIQYLSVSFMKAKQNHITQRVFKLYFISVIDIEYAKRNFF